MYANWALSWNTNRTYSSGEKQFIQFCLMNRLLTPAGDILPPSEGTRIYFAPHLARTLRHSTIKIYLVAVRKGFTGHSPLPGSPPHPASPSYPPGSVSYSPNPPQLVRG